MFDAKRIVKKVQKKKIYSNEKTKFKGDVSNYLQ